jgi:hypothetical protein
MADRPWAPSPLLRAPAEELSLSEMLRQRGRAPQAVKRRGGAPQAGCGARSGSPHAMELGRSSLGGGNRGRRSSGGGSRSRAPQAAGLGGASQATGIEAELLGASPNFQLAVHPTFRQKWDERAGRFERTSPSHFSEEYSPSVNHPIPLFHNQTHTNRG